MSSSFAIRVQNLGKRYHLYGKPQDRLKQAIVPRLYRGISWLGAPFGMRAKPVPYYYRDFWALQEVTLEIEKGQTVGIVGPNGAGKSTLLQLVCGTLTPTVGEIEVNGRVAALLELGAGFKPEFTGRENVYMHGAIAGMSRKEIDSRFDDIAAFADIGEFIEQPLKTYSSGMFVRLAFAAAINVDPNILVVDEALSVGDAAFQSKCLARIRDMQERGATILLVSHNYNSIVEFCSQAILLQHGQIVTMGKCRDVLEVYANMIIDAERMAVSGGGENAEEKTRVQAGVNELSSTAGRAKSEIIAVLLTDEEGREKKFFAMGDTLFVRVIVKSHEAVAIPCVGLNIMSRESISLWSVTTKEMGVELPTLEAGKEHTYVWRIPVDMGTGAYSIALGVGEIESGTYARHFRLNFAGDFEVLPNAYPGWGWLPLKPGFESSGQS